MSVIDALQVKEGDVFAFSYSQESWAAARTGIGHGDLHWCFDGQLVYRDGRLVDTYWAGLDLRRGLADSRSFTVVEAVAAGDLRYVCNLNDVEKIQPHEYELYADGDAFNLSHQHSCYKFFVKRKGAKKDKARLLAAVHRKVQDARTGLERAASRLEYAVMDRERLVPLIEAGEEPRI